jgi:hypothetical protein
LQIPEKGIKRKLHENDMISDGYKRNIQLQIPEKNQKIITQTFTEKKVSSTAFCAFRTLALTCCIASCLSPPPRYQPPSFLELALAIATAITSLRLPILKKKNFALYCNHFILNETLIPLENLSKKHIAQQAVWKSS